MTHPVARFTIRTRMTARDTREPNRTASPLELLFDLTFVVAVAQIADQLAIGIEHGNGMAEILPFVMVFFAIWWAWINFTWFASAYDTDDVPYRLLTLVQMAGVLVLAAGVPTAFTTHGFLGITLGYLIMRIGLVAQWIRVAAEDPDSRPTAVRYAIGVTVVQLGWVGRLFLPTDANDAWWTVYLAFFVLVLFEGAVPVWAERVGKTSWHAHHIAERYSLFTIILLGETIAALAIGIGLVLAHPHLLVPLVTTAVSILLIIFGLWWAYFMEPSAEGLGSNRGWSYYWGYGHYLILAALGALGAGIQVVVGDVGTHPQVNPEIAAYAMAVPVALYLLSLWAANAPLVPRVVIRAWIVVPGAVLVLLVPSLVPSLGLAADVALLALVIAAFISVSVVVKVRTGQVES